MQLREELQRQKLLSLSHLRAPLAIWPLPFVTWQHPRRGGTLWVVASQRAPRFRLEESIAAICRINGHQRRSVGVTRDISTTGLFFYANFRPDEGSRLELILTLPVEITNAESLPVFCVGRVVRVEPNDVAGRHGVAVEIERCQSLSAA